MRKADLRAVVTRREALTATARIGVAGFILGMKRRAGAKEQAAQLGAKVCILTPEAVEGPFYFDPKLVRSDITEEKQGTPLLLTLQTVEATDCAPLQGARVDMWHADGLGLYSRLCGSGDRFGKARDVLARNAIHRD